MVKDAPKTIVCCGKALPNNKVSRHRHRKAMKEAGVDCLMQKQTVGRMRLCDTPEKRAKRREAYAKKKRDEKKARKEQEVAKELFESLALKEEKHSVAD